MLLDGSVSPNRMLLDGSVSPKKKKEKEYSKLLNIILY
jgi:hypothetical protein